MLKGKKGLYILLPLNLFIWGYMGYKIYAALNDSEALDIGERITAPPKLKLNDSVEYVPKINYKDPFLKEEPRGRNNTSMVQSIPVARPAALQKPSLPEKKVAEIKYLGLIENKSTGLTAAMVSVNGDSRVIKPGQVIDGISFQSITPDFIVVKIGKEKITIAK